MAYNKTKYQQLRSLEVPHKLALSLSDDASPVAKVDTAAYYLGINDEREVVFDSETNESAIWLEEANGVPSNPGLVEMLEPVNGESKKLLLKRAGIYFFTVNTWISLNPAGASTWSCKYEMYTGASHAPTYNYFQAGQLSHHSGYSAFPSTPFTFSFPVFDTTEDHTIELSWLAFPTGSLQIEDAKATMDSCYVDVSWVGSL